MDVEGLRGSLEVIYMERSGEFYLLYSFFFLQSNTKHPCIGGCAGPCSAHLRFSTETAEMGLEIPVP